jgi:hypothetical protein
MCELRTYRRLDNVLKWTGQDAGGEQATPERDDACGRGGLAVVAVVVELISGIAEVFGSHVL